MLYNFTMVIMVIIFCSSNTEPSNPFSVGPLVCVFPVATPSAPSRNLLLLKGRYITCRGQWLKI